MSERPRRKTIRLHREAYETPHLPFSITTRCDSNRRLFLKGIFADTVYESIFKGPLKTQAELSAVCLMPDHLHLLIAPLEKNLIDLIGNWKKFTTNVLCKMGVQGKVWQRSFYDHALRKEEDIVVVATYIVNNPVRAGLVDSWEEYPYAWHCWADGD